MNATESVRGREHSGWVDHTIATTPQGCIKRFSRNRSLLDNLGQVFAHLCQTLRVLCNYRQCLHLFVNRALPEADVLWPSGGNQAYRRLRYEQLHSSFSSLRQITKWDERARGSTDTPECLLLSAMDLLKLSGLLEEAAESSQQGKTAKMEIAATVSKSDTGILVPFDRADLNLGFFVLWGQRSIARAQAGPEDEALHKWSASTFKFLKEFLEREYPLLTKETYLPSFYATRWTKAAILFADIKNFAPLTQILRNVYGQPGQRDTTVLMDILNEHCREMAHVIQQEGRGRIDRFIGPGVMAIFGEHERNPTKAASCAAYVATKMVQRFETLRHEFLKTAFGVGYEIEYNESVDIQLAIGIDYGTVLFDYLGDDDHREYTVIGDHVTHAEQLQYQALGADKSGCQYPPILVSPTVERCIRPFIKFKECVLRETETSAVCTAYGISPENFDTVRFLECLQSDDWEGVWAEKGLTPPRQPAPD